MKAMIHISPKQDRESISCLTNAICDIMMCAKEAERNDATTRVALSVLAEASSIGDVTVSDCTLTNKE